MTVRGQIKGIITWNGYFYGYVRRKVKMNHFNKYYRSKNCRFDDTCGGTEEITSDEYTDAAKKYAEVMRG